RATGNVVVEVKLRNRLLGAGSFSRDQVGIFEKQVAGFHFRTRGAEESQIQARRLLHPEGLRQRKTSVFSFEKEDSHPVDQQCPRQAVLNRSEHLVEVSFSAQLPPKRNESFAIVITGAIEEQVDVLLNPFANGIEEQRGGDHRDDESDRSRAWNLS